MRRARIIPVALALVMALFAVLAYRTWNDEQQDRETDRIADCFTTQTC